MLIIQSEDDRQDAREQARVIRYMNLTKEQITLVRKNTRFITWRGSGYTELLEHEDGTTREREIGFSVAEWRAASAIGAGHDRTALIRSTVLAASVRLIRSVRPFAKCGKLASSGDEAKSV